MTDNVFDRVKEMVVEHLKIDDPSRVVKEARFIEDLGADSLDTVELVMAFEEVFELEIPESDANTILTIGDAVDFIAKAEKNKK
ncbi:MAG: acyl carrier protein [Candidatus Liberibacter ctenarytainae]|uniref:Acyl carrier protein n=1 Tax=Candidatus Liberibacter ctenarytainae TaxID=2020335 RepID=A0A937ACY4_9HYPH|nr:acyl carrier protein [Candidatus Liberibacter ctenarytainae]